MQKITESSCCFSHHEIIKKVCSNMGRYFLSSVFMLTAGLTVSAQSMTMQWTDYLDTSMILPQDMKTDASGNVVMAGGFSKTVDFDPGPGVTSFTCGPWDIDAYIAKYASNGTLIWVKVFPSPTHESFMHVAINPSGDIIVDGFFYGDLDLDPGSGVATAVHNGNSDCDFLLAKYDGNGNYIWSKYWGGPGAEFGGALQLDNSGNILVAGTFTGTCDLDPGPGVHNLSAAGGNLDRDVFLSKFNTNGNLLWTWQMGGANMESMEAIAVDGADNIYCTGYVQGPVDLDPGAGQAILNGYNGYMAHYTSNGLFLWVRQFDFTPIAVNINSQQKIYMSGNYLTSFDADPGSAVVTIPHIGGYDIAIILFDTSGIFVRAGYIAGPAHHMIGDSDLDSSGNLILSGEFETAADFDPGSGTHTLTPPGSGDPFVLILNDQLNLVNVLQIPCSGGDGAIQLMSYNASGDLYVFGGFTGTADFDPTSGTYAFTSPSSVGSKFFSKYNTITGISELSSHLPPEFCVYPNPFDDQLMFSGKHEMINGTATLYDICGRIVQAWTGLNGIQHQLTVGPIQNGIYMLVITDGECTESIRVTRQ
jgi:hypothetical protein